jgi:predicted Zn-dependent protease
VEEAARSHASALKEARLLRTREPDNPQYRLAFAVCLAEKGDLDAAVAELEALARVRPGDLDVLDRLRACSAK